MTIDRVIKDLKGEFSSPYNNQLAEWLEELKELRETNRTLSLGEGHFITEDNLDKSIDNAYLKGHNKAVDDLTANITERFSGMAMSSGLPTEGATWENAIRQVKEISERLKGAKQNEDFKQ